MIKCAYILNSSLIGGLYMQDIYTKLLENNIKKENIFLDEDMSKHTSF